MTETQLPIDDPTHPPFIVTHDSEEFEAVIIRAARGEFRVEFCERVPQHNCYWRFKLIWP